MQRWLIKQFARCSLAACSPRGEWRLRWLVLALLIFAGCATTEYVSVRPTPTNALANTLNLLDKDGPKVTARTEQYLRRYDLALAEDSKTQDTLKKLQENLIRDPSPDACQAFSEIAYLGGLKLQETNPKEALNLYGAAVTHSYYYLFDPRFAQFRNPYDPQFRQVCDIYNQSLESCLRLMKKDKKIHATCAETFVIGDHTLDLKIEMKNGRGRSRKSTASNFAAISKSRGSPTSTARLGSASRSSSNARRSSRSARAKNIIRRI